MDEDFAKWYTDVCIKAELIDYASVKGCMIIRPYGYAIWELIQSQMDARFKATGHENVYMPMFIPESLLQKEKDLNQLQASLEKKREEYASENGLGKKKLEPSILDLEKRIPQLIEETEKLTNEVRRLEIEKLRK